MLDYNYVNQLKSQFLFDMKMQTNILTKEDIRLENERMQHYSGAVPAPQFMKTLGYPYDYIMKDDLIRFREELNGFLAMPLFEENAS